MSWLLLAWFWNVDMWWGEVISYFCLKMEPSFDKCRGPQTTKHMINLNVDVTRLQH